jgi:bacterioferritin (cytochrome b1)
MDMDDLFPKPRMPRSMAFTMLAGLKIAAEELQQAEAEGPASPFAVPVDEVLLHLKGLIAHEFKMHQWYTYYAEVLRGENRAGAAELFEELAPKELEDAQYFLRRASALRPGALQLPAIPSPAAKDDLAGILQIMLVEEERAVLLLGHLRNVVGQDPMGYALEGMMAEEQGHADQLKQHLAAGKPGAKVAAAVEQLKTKQKGGETKAGPVTAESAIIAHQQAAMEQAVAENEDLKARLQETSTVAAQHAQAAEEAAMAHQEAAMAAEEAQMAAQGATEEVMLAQQQAGAEADAKMRIAIRMQQLRQTLADIVSQDPVQEEGADAPAITTATQAAGAMMDPAMGGDPMAGDPAAAGAAGTEVVEEPAAAPAPKKEKAPPAKEKQAVSAEWVKKVVRSSGADSLRREKFLNNVTAISDQASTKAFEAGKSLAKKPVGREAVRTEAVRNAHKYAGAVSRAGELLSGRKFREHVQDAKGYSAMAKSLKNRNAALVEHYTNKAQHARGDARAEAVKVLGARAGAVGGATAAAGAATRDKEAGVLGRAKELVTGSGVKRLQQHADLLGSEKKIWRESAAREAARGNHQGASRLGGIANDVALRGSKARRAVEGEKSKVLGTRVTLGATTGAAGAQAAMSKKPEPVKQAGALSRAGQLLTGSRAHALQGELEGAAHKHYLRGSAHDLALKGALSSEKDKVRTARVVAGAAGAVGAGAGVHAATKKDKEKQAGDECCSNEQKVRAAAAARKGSTMTEKLERLKARQEGRDHGQGT